jgi:hypothetical protein
MTKRKRAASGDRRPQATPGGLGGPLSPEGSGGADAVTAHEQQAVDDAVDKLAALGPLLAFPHSSKAMGEARA